MNLEELKIRTTAWTWAAMTLGVEASPERIRGLVEVTKGVALNRLKPALEAVIKTEPAGFLPSPGAVIEAAKRQAEREHADQPRVLSAGREMSKEDHRKWMAEANPEGWDDETWKAFVERMATDLRYRELVHQARDRRHEWAEAEVTRVLGRRRTDQGYRIKLRKQLNVEAFDHFPRPHPLADGWVQSKNFDPIAGLTKRMSP